MLAKRYNLIKKFDGTITIFIIFSDFSIVTHFIFTYHISLVNVQTNYGNSLMILDVKKLNKITKLYYFYTLKALSDG